MKKYLITAFLILTAVVCFNRVHYKIPGKELVVSSQSGEFAGYDIPVFGSWIPVVYSFACPNLLEYPRFEFGGGQYFIMQDNLEGPFAALDLDLKEVKKVERIVYYDGGKATIAFVKYTLQSSRPVRVKNRRYFNEEKGIVCLKVEHPNPSRKLIGELSVFYCCAQRNNKLVLVESAELNSGKNFLRAYLDGKRSSAYLKFLPSLSILAELEKQLDIRECSIMNSRIRFTDTSAGENGNRETKKINIKTSRARLHCRINKAGIGEVSLTVLTVDNAAIMAQLVQESYSRESRDIEFRQLTGRHLSREGPLVVRYYKNAGIWIYRPIQNSLLILHVGYQESKHLAGTPEEFDTLVEKVKILAQGITFHAVDITRLYVYGEPSQGALFFDLLE
jgi:hypothetical protein